jgi:hypothetical protein
MIRYVPIDQDTGVMPGENCFAWFDTVTDTFITLCGDQVWASWSEFETDFIHDGTHTYDIRRFLRLFPSKTLSINEEPAERGLNG